MRIEEIGGATLINGDCRVVMAAMPENSVDAIVCDPPYGLGFMGKGWDHGVPGVEFWIEALRVAKPGAHLLAFGGTRTHHRLMVAIEDAGWELRDTVMWVYGSGFPKSLDVSKAIDKEAGAEREIIGVKPGHERFANRGNMSSVQSLKGTLGGKGGFSRPWMDDPEAVERYHSQTAPSTDAAKQWQGWGTALKPAWEPIIVARKPLEGTVADNVQKWGTGGLNIDGCRIEGVKGTPASPRRAEQGAAYSDLGNDPGTGSGWDKNVGRWPANMVHDGSEEVLECFPESKALPTPHLVRNDTGSAARFFYCAKASKADRNEGCEIIASTTTTDGRAIAADNAYQRGKTERNNNHPTVKPTNLMRYLCRLVTPPNGTVLDPFMGSGSTGKAALQKGFKFVGIELDKEHRYFDIACARIKAAL